MVALKSHNIFVSHQNRKKILCRTIVQSEGFGSHYGLIRGLSGRTMVSQYFGLHYGLIRGLHGCFVKGHSLRNGLIRAVYGRAPKPG